MKLAIIIFVVLLIASCASIESQFSSQTSCRIVDGLVTFTDINSSVRSRYRYITINSQLLRFTFLSPFSRPALVLEFSESELQSVSINGEEANREMLGSMLSDYSITLPNLDFLTSWVVGSPHTEDFELISQSTEQLNFNEIGWRIFSTFSSENTIPVRNIFEYKGTIIELETQNIRLTCDGV